MRILVAGGGPAGLLFALLMKRQDPRHAIRVLEQNPADNTYGWGVVFSGRALEFLQAEVPDLYRDLGALLEVWDKLTIVHRDVSMAVDGSSFSGIARLSLLEVLQTHCRRAGVDLRFDESFDLATAPSGVDLIVGADGVSSQVREHYSERFGTRREELTNRFVWYGTRRVFDSLSLIFRETAAGHFVAHTYRYSSTMSTFLVECDAATFERSGLGEMSDAESRTFCEEIFEKDLQGNALQSNHSNWRQFPVIENQQWHCDNVVLLGDALRTVHFSIGSGTRTAMEDAIALATALRDAPDVPQGLDAYVSARKPSADRLMSVAKASMDWYEGFAEAMAASSWEFAMSYMTRGGRVSLDAMRERSPEFVSAYERAVAGND